MEEPSVYSIVLASFIMPLLLSTILIWFVVNYQRKKAEYEISKRDQEIREQQLIIQRQQALAHERTRIAAEMHDDLGGGLTSIKFLSQNVLRNTNDERQKAQIKKVVNHAQTLVGNMSEIIWAMDAGHDTVENLAAYCRRYAKTYLDEHDISLHFENDIQWTNQSISGEKRRNIFLIVKEALHNVVKHAQASKVSMKMKSIDNHFTLIIKDDGKGMPDKVNEGNGLENMRKRAVGMGGEFNCSSDDGVLISIALDLSANKMDDQS